jgi:hypothetical protein
MVHGNIANYFHRIIFCFVCKASMGRDMEVIHRQEAAVKIGKGNWEISD